MADRLSKTQLQIPDGEFHAYLFDCDGTIADTMPLHHRAWCQALSKWGCEFPVALFYAWGGIPGEKIVEMLNERNRLSIPPEEAVRAKEDRYFESLSQVRPVPEVLVHIERQHGKIPMAVVSGSPRDSVLRTLTTLQLLDRFDAVIGAEDYTFGKPHPEPFLTAARRLEIPPHRCLVFEDADLGIESARSAGMAYVKVPAIVHQ